MQVIRETLWKRCLSTPTKPLAQNSNICLSETAYQHKGTRKKCKKTNQAAIIQWQRQCLTYKPHRKPWTKSKTSDISKQSPVHCITPFCSDALVSPPILYPPWLQHIGSVIWTELSQCLTKPRSKPFSVCGTLLWKRHLLWTVSWKHMA